MSTAIQEQVWALLVQVPREPNTALPPGATQEAVDEFEARTGISLPYELCKWLKMCNGPCVGPGGLFGVAPASEFLLMEVHLSYEPAWFVKGWIPVAGDGTGKYYVLDSRTEVKQGHPVFFLDHERGLNEPEYVVASNIWQFLRFLLQEELDRQRGGRSSWPFHADSVLTLDPVLASCTEVAPLPWSAGS